MNPDKNKIFHSPTQPNLEFTRLVRARSAKQSFSRLFFIFLLFILHSSLFIAHAQPTQEWVARYFNAADGGLTAPQLALDKLGNSYVLGNIPVGGGVGNKMILIKYNSSGDTLWTRFYDAGTNNLAYNVALAADSLGNAYATGYAGQSFGPYNIVTFKYNPSGVLQWTKIYAGAGNVSDIPEDLKLDRQNNIYVTGVSSNKCVTIKYNPAGDSVWVRLFNPAGYYSVGISIGMDPQNNLYIGGLSKFISTNRNYFMVVKYDSSGNFRWEGTYTGIGFESPHKLAVDRFGNAYLTGEGSDGVNNGCLTVKFDSSGILQWQKAYSGNNLGDFGYANAVDLLGNIYVTGATAITNTNYDYRTIKYDSNGDTLWVRKYNGPGNDDDEAYAIALDDSANVYITGRSIGSGTSWDYATIKYNSLGIQQWAIRYDYAGVEDIPSSIALDFQKNVVITGVSNRGGQNYDYATIKYSQFTGIDPISNQIPEMFRVFQNYPNPFNPSTKFKFEVPKLSYVQIKIYDIIGREVKILVSETLHPGIYETEWNASSYASGIYFYKMTAGNFSETKKMVIIK